MSGRANDLIVIPDTLWQRSEVIEALRSRRIGRFFQLVQQHTGASQTQIGIAIGWSQGKVSDLERGVSGVKHLTVFEDIADGLKFPDSARTALGLASRVPPSQPPGHQPSRAILQGNTPPVLQGNTPPVSEQLGRSDGARYPAEAATAVSLLDTLASADMNDRLELIRADWTSDSASRAITDYLFSSPMWHSSSLPADSLGNSIADRIREFTRHLADLDFQYGGGHIRKTLLFYFRNEIVPLLHRSYPESIRREILSAAAGVTQLIGWSAYDAGRHGLSQRYYTQGLRLAREAEDPVFGAYLLSDLSHQANYLGRFNEALQFARAAQASAAGKASHTVNAMFLSMEARALANSGDAKACIQALHRAEHEFDQRRSENDPAWIGYFDALELAGEAAHCFRDLGQSHETRLFAAQAMDPVATPPRTQAFISMVTAAGAFGSGNLDEALSLATAAVNLTGSLESSRYIRYLTDFHESVIEGHSSHPEVREFTGLLARTYPHLELRPS